jgi:hypothetical protein
MTPRDGFKALAALALGAVAMHLLWSSVLAAIVDHFYRHRAPDISRVDGSYRFELFGRFMAHERSRTQRPIVAFVGSSFTYGYPWQESVIFSRRATGLFPEAMVLNLSMLSADTSSLNDWVFCSAKASGIAFDVAVVEIPVVNEASQLAQYRRRGLPPPPMTPLARCGLEPRTANYAGYFARHPYGVGWLRPLWDPNAYEQPDRTLPSVVVPPHYFADSADFAGIEREYAARVRAMLSGARAQSRSVIAYPSPILLSEVAKAGQDVAALRRQLEVALEACRAVPDVVCVEPAFLYDRREDFLNLTHLNQRGHEEMAAWLGKMRQ